MDYLAQIFICSRWNELILWELRKFAQIYSPLFGVQVCFQFGCNDRVVQNRFPFCMSPSCKLWELSLVYPHSCPTAYGDIPTLAQTSDSAAHSTTSGFDHPFLIYLLLQQTGFSLKPNVFQFQHELSSCHKSSVHVSAVSVACMTHQVSVSCEADQESVATHGVPGHDDWNIFHLKSQTCHQYCLA